MIKRRWLVPVVLVFIAGVAGCSAVSGNATPTVLPSICATPDRLTDLGPTSLNKDYKRRDKILGITVEWGKTDLGGIQLFEQVSLSTAALLYEEKFIDLSDRQNLAPTAGELLKFMCVHPGTMVSGYAVSPNREDYRITIDAIQVPSQYVTADVRVDFETLCQHADELDTSGDLFCWCD